jgi:hypothetical protein
VLGRRITAMETALWTVVGVGIGALITWLVSKYYYVRASQDLLQETNRLKRMNEIGLGVLEEKGYVKLNRDGQGNIVGRVIELKANILGTSSTSVVELEVKGGE